jgi:hypothetical protein
MEREETLLAALALAQTLRFGFATPAEYVYNQKTDPNI